MTVRTMVKDAQRKLAELDVAHARAVARLERATARRAAVLVEQDRLVTLAQEDLDRTVSSMIDEIGLELTATVLGLRPNELRRVARSANRDRRTPGHDREVR